VARAGARRRRFEPWSIDNLSGPVGKERAQAAIGTLTLMGVRLYDPAIGRFLQTDPISGGNANAYVYRRIPLTRGPVRAKRRYSSRRPRRIGENTSCGGSLGNLFRLDLELYQGRSDTAPMG
jgi:RHS repeat-associated protein